jgi:hypothetical protein
MNTKKQRYCLVFHARVDENVSAKQRHASFFEGIATLPIPWGLATGAHHHSPILDVARLRLSV